MNHTLPLLAAALLSAAPAAWPGVAQAADDVAQARTQFEKGAKLFRAGKYRDAIAAFETAYRLKPHGAIHFNVAQCRERLEEWPGALRSYQDYLREVPDASDRAAVRAAIQKIEQRIAKAGVQALLVYSDPPGAVVKLDGKPRGRTPFHITLPPGLYKVGLALDGYQAEEVEAEVSIAAFRLVDVVLRTKGRTAAAAIPLPPPPIVVAPPPAAGAPAAPTGSTQAPPPTAQAGPGTSMSTGVPGAEPATPIAPAAAKPVAAAPVADLTVKPPEGSPLAPPKEKGPSPKPGERRRVYTWVAAGAAVAAVAAGAFFGAASGAESDKIADGTIRTRPEIDAIESRAKQKATTANVLYGVAGAAAAAGVTLFFIEGSF